MGTQALLTLGLHACRVIATAAMLSTKQCPIHILSSDLFLLKGSLLASNDTYICQLHYLSRRETIPVYLTVMARDMTASAVSQSIGLNQWFLEEHRIGAVC